MGRRSGVSAEETRAELLAAAMRVLLARGYEGTRVSEISREAGVTTGAIYNHFGSKAELLEAAIIEQAPDAIAGVLGGSASGGEVGSIAAAFIDAGSSLADHARVMGPLLIELIATATRDGDIAKVVQRGFADKERTAADVIRAGQDGAEIDPALDAEALSRFVTLLALGSMAAAALDLKPIDDDAWRAVIGRTVAGVRPPSPTDPVRP